MQINGNVLQVFLPSKIRCCLRIQMTVLLLLSHTINGVYFLFEDGHTIIQISRWRRKRHTLILIWIQTNCRNHTFTVHLQTNKNINVFFRLLALDGGCWLLGINTILLRLFGIGERMLSSALFPTLIILIFFLCLRSRCLQFRFLIPRINDDDDVCWVSWFYFACITFAVYGIHLRN